MVAIIKDVFKLHSDDYVLVLFHHIHFQFNLLLAPLFENGSMEMLIVSVVVWMGRNNDRQPRSLPDWIY